VALMAGTEPWTHRDAVVNGVRLHYVEQGQGPLVVLLHGFPEFWYSWRHQIPTLAEAGFRVIAPDQRGYNTSEKPRGVRSYRVEHLVDDVAALIQHAGESRATVVGHDWGGAVAWAVPMLRPEVVDKLIVLNAPHPQAYNRELRRFRQLLRSWYVFFFQLPWLPEAGIRFRHYRLIERTMTREPKRPGAFSEDDIAAYKQALAQPGALSAGINYYRAAVRRNPFASSMLRQIDTPTLLIWGEEDPYLGIRLTEGLQQWVPKIRVERIPNASHWVQIDAAERVNELMIDFLRS
jgi:pimeloyl-ACP methyl ester carboxylesterase